MFKALSEAGINVEMISTSEVRVNVVVAADKGDAGLDGAARRVCRRAGMSDSGVRMPGLRNDISDPHSRNPALRNSS